MTIDEGRGGGSEIQRVDQRVREEHPEADDLESFVAPECLIEATPEDRQGLDVIAERGMRATKGLSDARVRR